MKDIEADLLIANVEIRQLKAERDALQKEVLKHRAKQYQGVNYALEQAVCELIHELGRLTQDNRDLQALLAEERKISDYLRSPVQKWNW